MGNIPLWLCIPFAGLLLCIAIFPLVKGEWWDKNKGWAVLIWSLLFIIPFAVKYGAGETAVPSFFVRFSFSVHRSNCLKVLTLPTMISPLSCLRKHP